MTEQNNGDLVRRYFPDVSDEEAEGILWSETGFPCFFSTNQWYPTALARLRQQLRAFKYKIKRGKE